MVQDGLKKRGGILQGVKNEKKKHLALYYK